MGKVVINGKTYTGNNISVSNGVVIIDGKPAESNDKKINISITGNINDLNVDYCESIDIKGDVDTIKTSSGDVDVIGEVKGSIKTTSGDIECGDVGGDVETTSGDINCENVNGSVKTVSGDIKHKHKF